MITKIHETDAYGCHITIEKLGWDRFHVTVSYKSYNDLGVWVASPEWGNVGTGEQMYQFLLETIARAQGHNKPIIALDLPLLNQ